MAGLVIAVVMALLAVPAFGETPRQTYSERFTTEQPGAPTGRNYVIDWVNPADPDAKPPSFSHLHVELAPGSRFDTSAVPQCHASDALLMLVGSSACPSGSRVAEDHTIIDTGLPGAARYAATDLAFFNNRDELVILATIRGSGARVVLRGRVGMNTIDLDVPLLPGTPPDGGAATYQRGGFYRRPGYLTTPPSCPPSGYWVNSVTYTYRDGVTQTASSRTPCRPAGSAALRCAGRKATIVGTRGKDRLVGTSGRDVIVALEGNDRVRAGGGRDVVCAGSGRDRVRGGSGNDRLLGGRGPDKLFGGTGDDRLFGGPGLDVFAGGPGRDRRRN